MEVDIEGHTFMLQGSAFDGGEINVMLCKHAESFVKNAGGVCQEQPDRYSIVHLPHDRLAKTTLPTAIWSKHY